MKFLCEVGVDKFYMRKDVEGDGVIVDVTDLKSLWRVSMTEVEIVNRFRGLNPLVQAQSDWIVTYVRSGLDSEKSTFGLVVDGSQLTLNMHSTTDVKTKMSFSLNLQDSQLFFKNVTNPMVAVIAHLMEQRNKLLEMVKSKDLELREYKLEGAEISRKNVQTDEIIGDVFLAETTEDFTSKIRQDRVPRLNLTSDLNEIFIETLKLKDEVVIKSEPDDTAALGNGVTFSAVKAEKRPIGNETIIQVPRAKERKKRFKI